MSCSGIHCSIAVFANWGLRREPGAVRTSTNSTTLAWWRSAAKSSDSVVPWPTVIICGTSLTLPLHHVGSDVAFLVGAGVFIDAQLPACASVRLPFALHRICRLVYTAFLITLVWDLRPRYLRKMLMLCRCPECWGRGRGGRVQ